MVPSMSRAMRRGLQVTGLTLLGDRTGCAAITEPWFNNHVARPKTITDERLLAAAAQVIARKGPGFTIADVAARAEVSVGTVAQRFGSKSGLLQALTRQTAADVTRRMRQAAARED